VLGCPLSAMKRRFAPQQTSPLFDHLVSGFGVARMMRALCKKARGAANISAPGLVCRSLSSLSV
jgi:hypothetical protein